MGTTWVIFGRGRRLRALAATRMAQAVRRAQRRGPLRLAADHRRGHRRRAVPGLTRVALLLALACLTLRAEVRFAWRRISSGEDIAGAAVEGRTLLTWGGRVRVRQLPGGAARDVAGAATAAALMDVDGDGLLDLVAADAKPPALAWYAAPRWIRRPIEAGVESDDLLPATLSGRRGVLVIHKRSQLRFYQIPHDPAGAWPARDLYSIYTPAWQGGLAVADVDRDGRADIYCGNYWLRAPERFELPWRLFAINTWTEEEASGMMRLAPLPAGGLAVAQRKLAAGRAAWFERPADPLQLWRAHGLGEFDRPASLAAADFDGDGRLDLLLAEQGPAGRVVAFEGPAFTPRVLRSGTPALALRVVRLRGRKLPDVVLLTPSATEYGESMPAR